MNIKILHHQEVSDPEVVAMLMAFYSRSSKPIIERIATLGNEEKEIKKALSKYYLNYGHASIADCAFAPVFLEGISFLAAKAVESHPLFNGQETSSRYIDFSNQGFIDPLNNHIKATQILKNWVEFYQEIQLPVKDYLTQKYPIQSNQSLSTYTRALEALCFDITRSLLPAGMKTQVGLSMTLRSLQEHCWALNHHPTKEVRNLAENLLKDLKEKYPSSFKDCPPQFNSFLNQISEYEFFLKEPNSMVPELEGCDINFKTDSGWLPLHTAILNNRPQGVGLPSFLNRYGIVQINYSLDFGSWRDLQRHRNTLRNHCTYLGYMTRFNKSYLAELSSPLKEKINTFVRDQYKEIFNLKLCLRDREDLYELQYYYPLGNFVNAELVCTIPELFYILELRSSPSVHFTLRNLIQTIWSKIDYKFIGMNHHIREDLSSFNYNRGTQTIHQKNVE